jgi:hypothetical protein
MYLSEAEFREAVERIVADRDEGNAWLLVGPAGIRIVFAEASDADDELVRRSDEVEDALEAAVVDRPPESYARRRITPARRLFGDVDEPEDVDVAAAKLEVARQHFDIDELRRRRWLKTTSKTDTPAAVEWDVSSKFAEDSIPLPVGGPVPFALLRVVAHARNPQDPSHLHPDIVLTLDAEDISYFRASLLELKDALEKVSTTE